MYYEEYFWGMNFIWWGVWILLIFWIFFLPYDIPFQRTRRETPHDILKKRLAHGHITPQEYANTLHTLEVKRKRR